MGRHLEATHYLGGGEQGQWRLMDAGGVAEHCPFSSCRVGLASQEVGRGGKELEANPAELTTFGCLVAVLELPAPTHLGILQ